MLFLEFFEALPLPELFIATLAAAAAVGTLVVIAVRSAVRLIGVDADQPIPIRDALISSLSAIFALMVAFSAAGIWNDAIQARGAIQREANAIDNVNALSAQLPDALREEVQAAMLRYGRRVIEKDWPAMQRRAGVNETLYERGNGPIVRLIDRISGAGGGATAFPLSELLIGQLLDLRSARLQREIIARGGVSAAQWGALIIIATAAMVVLAIAHNHASGLQAAAVGLYAIGVSAAFFVVLAHDRPFVGRSGVQPLPIKQAIETIERSYIDR